jgi:hypothetical protein
LRAKNIRSEHLVNIFLNIFLPSLGFFEYFFAANKAAQVLAQRPAPPFTDRGLAPAGSPFHSRNITAHDR